MCGAAPAPRYGFESAANSGEQRCLGSLALVRAARCQNCAALFDDRFIDRNTSPRCSTGKSDRGRHAFFSGRLASVLQALAAQARRRQSTRAS